MKFAKLEKVYHHENGLLNLSGFEVFKKFQGYIVHCAY